MQIIFFANKFLYYYLILSFCKDKYISFYMETLMGDG